MCIDTEEIIYLLLSLSKKNKNKNVCIELSIDIQGHYGEVNLIQNGCLIQVSQDGGLAGPVGWEVYWGLGGRGGITHEERGSAGMTYNREGSAPQQTYIAIPSTPSQPPAPPDLFVHLC